MKKNYISFKLVLALLIGLGFLLFFLYMLAQTADGATVEVQGEYIYGRQCTDFDSMFAIFSWQGAVERDTVISQACSVRALVWVDSVGWYQLKKIYWIGDGILVEREWVTSYYTPWIVSSIDSSDEHVKAIARYAWDDGIVARSDRAISMVDSVDTLIKGVAATATVDSGMFALAWDDNIIAQALRTVGNVAGLGSGGTPCSTYVMDADTNAIEGVAVSLYSTGGTRYANWTTDSNGRIIFSTAAETYLAYVGSHWITQTTIPDTIVVGAGNGANDTIWATTFDPGSAPEPGLCRVYGYIVNLSSSGVAAWVEAKADSQRIVYDGMVVWHYAVRDTADSDGYWYLDLFPSDSINSDYTFRLDYGGDEIRTVESYEVPDSATHWFIGQ